MEIMDVDGASRCFLSWFCVSHIRANSRETAHCIGELVIETPSQARVNTVDLDIYIYIKQALNS